LFLPTHPQTGAAWHSQHSPGLRPSAYWCLAVVEKNVELASKAQQDPAHTPGTSCDPQQNNSRMVSVSLLLASLAPEALWRR